MIIDLDQTNLTLVPLDFTEGAFFVIYRKGRKSVCQKIGKDDDYKEEILNLLKIKKENGLIKLNIKNNKGFKSFDVTYKMLEQKLTSKFSINDIN